MQGISWELGELGGHEKNFKCLEFEERGEKTLFEILSHMSWEQWA